MKKKLINIIRRISSMIFFQNIERDLQALKLTTWFTQKHLEQMHEYELRKYILDKQPNSLIRYGFSVYSQNDEDGIIQHIFEKLNIIKPNFIEFGVGPTENNTLFLLLNGSKGAWVDGNIENYRDQINCKTLHLVSTFVTIDNIPDIIDDALNFIGIKSPDIDFISMDLDGNDYYFVEQIIKNSVLPKVFCVEYNAKFRQALMRIPYNENHKWLGDDYFGCSMMEYCNLLNEHYTLLVCNITGANAFFIRNDFKCKFDILDPAELYQPPRYYFSSMYKGHQSSISYINDLVNKINN